MNKLTNKIIEYKKIRAKELLDEIFKLLSYLLKEKSKYIYFKKWYSFNMYIKCLYCKKCKYNKEVDNKLEELDRRQLCDNCKKCICNKGYFNLKHNHLCEYKDVEQDLNIEILRLINNFDESVGDFNSYLSSSLWDWRPSFITLEFVESISCISLQKFDEKGDEQNLDIEDKKSHQKIKSNLNLEEILNECKTDNEKEICQLYLARPNITEEEIGKELGMTKQNISLILKKLRKRLKNYLTK